MSKPREWFIGWPDGENLEEVHDDKSGGVPVIEKTPHVEKCIGMHEDLIAQVYQLEGESQAYFVMATQSLEIVAKLQELLNCGDGLLSAKGKCNDLLCELILMQPKAKELLTKIGAK